MSKRSHSAVTIRVFQYLILTGCFVLSAAGQAQPERHGLAIIVVPTRTEADELRARIQQGASFDTLARQHSVDSSSSDGGFVGSVRLSDLREDYQSALAGLAAGEVSPVTGGEGDFSLLEWITPDEDTWRERNAAARAAALQGRYDNAAKFFLEAIEAAGKLPSRDYRLAQSLYGLGQVYVQQGRYPDAQKLYQQALPILEEVFGAENSNVASNLSGLADAYRLEGNYAGAEPAYRRSLEIAEKIFGADNPRVATVLNSLGLTYRSQGKLSEAEPVFQRVISILEKEFGAGHPNLIPSMNNLATLYRDEGQYDKARSLFERSLKIAESTLGPDHTQTAAILTNLAEIEINLKRYADAEALYDRLLAAHWGTDKTGSDGSTVRILEEFSSVLNLAYFRDSQFDAALERWKQAMEMASVKEELYVVMSNNLRGVELDNEAEALMQRAIRAFPDSRYLRAQLGEIYVGMNRQQAALQAFQQAIQMRDSSSDPGENAFERSLIYRHIASADAQLSRHDDAVASYQRALELLPGNVDTLIDLGDLFLNSNQLGEASAKYSEVLAADSDNARAHYGLAQVNLRQGRFSEAAAQAADALEKDPTLRRARYVRATALLRSGASEDGRVELQRYQKQERDAQEILNVLREVSVANRTAAARFQENPDEAIGMFLSAIQKHPDSAVLRLNLGLAQSKLGRHEAALKTFSAMVDGGFDDNFLVHLNLSLEYEALGNTRAAQQHRILYLQQYTGALTKGQDD